jgi:flagellar biosynthesis GTPase FlhF
VESLKGDAGVEIMTSKDIDGNCPIHIAAVNMRQNLVSLLQKAGQSIGIDYEILDGQGLNPEQVMRQVEDAKREELRRIEKEKELAKQKKAQEKAAERAKEAKEREVEKQVQELQRLKKKQAEANEEESKKKAPYMLLMFVAIVILLLYLLLKIGVATGATKRATKTVESEMNDLMDM